MIFGSILLLPLCHDLLQAPCGFKLLVTPDEFLLLLLAALLEEHALAPLHCLPLLPLRHTYSSQIFPLNNFLPKRKDLNSIDVVLHLLGLSDIHEAAHSRPNCFKTLLQATLLQCVTHSRQLLWGIPDCVRHRLTLCSASHASLRRFERSS